MKIVKIFLNTLPILIMVGLIPIVKNDYWLVLIYIFIILISFSLIKASRKDFIVFVFGLLAMIFFEYIFISTGVETFVRNSLFGIMPIWLPLLWGYGFVAIKRSVEIL